MSSDPTVSSFLYVFCNPQVVLLIATETQIGVSTMG
jgi:hypothetical protein